MTSKHHPKPHQIYTDLISGTLAGLIYILSNHPIDTLKVRMQSSKKNAFNTFKQLLSEGYFSFFRGIAYPLKMVPLMNAVSFGSY
jgi:hypothetical protein